MPKEKRNPSERLSLEKVSELAREILLQQGVHVPTLIVEGSRNWMVVQLAEMGRTSEERLHQLFLAGLGLGQRQELGKLQQVFLITEAWLSVAPKGTMPTVSPAQDAQHKEVLVVSTLDVQANHSRIALLEMVRDAQGELRELKPFSELGEDGQQVEAPLLRAFLLGYVTGLPTSDKA